jgi:hypothetical protein
LSALNFREYYFFIDDDMEAGGGVSVAVLAAIIGVEGILIVLGLLQHHILGGRRCVEREF